MSFSTPNQIVDEEELAKKAKLGERGQRCQGCNGPLKFDPTTQKLKCEYCESEYDIPRELDEEEKQGNPNSTIAGNPNNSSNMSATPIKRKRRGERPLEEADNEPNCDWGAKKKMVTCKSCGAQTIYDAVQTTNACPYCDSPQIMEDTENKDLLAPTGICVFKINREKACKAFYDWVNGLWFAPNSLKKLARANEINGMYLPHWTFDTNTSANYKGQYGIEDEKNHQTDWHKCQGHIEHFFDDFAIPACKKENNHILEALHPFDTNDYEDYKPEYMAGYVAERYSINVHDSWKEAQNRIQDELEKLASKDIEEHYANADRTKVDDIKVVYSNVMFKYLFLPVWLSSYQFNGKVYQFMVNGQTGKVSGDRPWSWIKIALVFIAIFGILFLLTK